MKFIYRLNGLNVFNHLGDANELITSGSIDRQSEGRLGDNRVRLLDLSDNNEGFEQNMKIEKE